MSDTQISLTYEVGRLHMRWFRNELERLAWEGHPVAFREGRGLTMKSFDVRTTPDIHHAIHTTIAEVSRG